MRTEHAGVAWIKDMAKGAALATQTKTLAVDYFGMHDLLPNTPPAQRMQKRIEEVGVPQYTKEELTYATDLQKSAGLEPKGMANKVLPLPNEPKLGGFTDSNACQERTDPAGGCPSHVV